MGKALDKQPMGNWVPNAAFGMTDTVAFWDANGNYTAMYCYLNEKDRAEWSSYFKNPEATVGWYLYEDANAWDYLNNKNGDEIPFGAMAAILSNSDEATITFSGEVRSGDVLDLNGGNNYLGNCSPVDLKIGKFRPNAAFGMTDTLTIWDKDGNIDGMFCYLNEADRAEWSSYFTNPSATVGWYLYEDANAWDYLDNRNEKDTIVAGRGFHVLSNSDEATIEIPDPVTGVYPSDAE